MKFVNKLETNCSYSFQLFDSKSDYLFKFGYENDICIMKEEKKDKCFCKQLTFDYNEKTNALVGKEGEENSFNVKRIQVWQMSLTKEQKHQKEKNAFKNELKKLEEVSQLILVEKKEEIKEIEMLTGLGYDRVVFDTDFCDWDANTTTIDKHILNREKLVFVIEDTNNNVFGGFINEKVDGVYYEEPEERGKYIVDKKSFIFSLKSNGRSEKSQKFYMKYDNLRSFRLMRKDLEFLFSFGDDDIFIYKNQLKEYCFIEPYLYNFEGNENVITGSIGNDHLFTVKQIQIWQMKTSKLSEQRINHHKNETYEFEKKQLKEFTDELIKNNENEITTIEELINLEFNEVIFNSDFCDWSVNTSTFDMHLFNRSNIVIRVEDIEGNIFGGFIKSKINSLRYEENNTVLGNVIDDKNSFVFSLKSNGRLDNPEKFVIKQEYADWAFQLYRSDEKYLFSIGGGEDISIKKKEMKSNNFCKQIVYDYKGKENVLIGKEGVENPFTVKQIQVWQMSETEIMKQQKMKGEKEYEKIRERLFDEEKKILKEKENEIDNEWKETKDLIEQWTEMKCDEVIFDSEFCNWKINTSTFDKHMFNKENIIFIIEDTEENIFGGYIKSKIISLRYEENGIWLGDKIFDKNAFGFSIKSNGRLEHPEKFIFKTEKSEWAFQLFKSDQNGLFYFGGADICIMKQEMKHKCYCESVSCDYNGRENVFTGKERIENPFIVKRILCWQMIETDEHKDEQKELQNEIFEKEQQLLIESTVDVKNDKLNIIKQIEEWSNSTFNKVIFDSNCCDYKVNTSTFHKHINDYDNCAFIVEDVDGNVFGGFITSTIGLKRFDHEPIGLCIPDKNAFVFSLKTNERLSQSMKFSIKSSQMECALSVFKVDQPILFKIGGSDINIPKEEYKHVCWNIQQSVEYGTYSKVLNGKESQNERYEVKHIQVWHFILTEEQQKQREEVIRKQEEVRKNMIEEESRQMKILSNNIVNEFKFEIEQIEEWSELSMKTVIFDSQLCDWSLESSTFVDHILHKEKLAFLIVTETGIKYGGFLYSKATLHFLNRETDEWQGSTFDPKSFIFTFKDDDPMKFCLKKEFKNKPSFYLCDNSISCLFAFGREGCYEIWIGKKEVSPFCCQNEKVSYYNFKGRKNALTGISGEKTLENQFPIKRVVVIQFQ